MQLSEIWWKRCEEGKRRDAHRGMKNKDSDLDTPLTCKSLVVA